MFKRLFLTALCSCLCSGAALAQNIPDPVFAMQGGTLVIKQGGTVTRLPADQVQSTTVQHSDFIFVAVDSSDEEKPWKKLGVPDGIYVGPASGPLRRIATMFNAFPPGQWEGEDLTPDVMAQIVQSASLSPDKKILALAASPTMEGIWLFYSWPDLQPISTAPYYSPPSRENNPELIWGRPDMAVMHVSAVDSDTAFAERQCGYDPCAIVSVQSFNVRTNTNTILFQGTPTCDYYLRSASTNEITVDKLCLKRARDWKEFPENIKPTVVKKPMP